MLVPLNSHHYFLGPKKWGTPKTWIRILAPNDGFSVSRKKASKPVSSPGPRPFVRKNDDFSNRFTPEFQRTPPHKHWSRMRGCCWDGQRLSTPEMESLVQNRIPFGIADFCHKIHKTEKTNNNNRKHLKMEKISRYLKHMHIYVFLYVHQNGSYSNLNLSGFLSASVEFLGSSKGSSIISYCLVMKKLSTAWNVIIPNNPQYLYIYNCIYMYIYIR